MYAANLLRGDTCQVRRAIGLSIFSSEMPCSQLSTPLAHWAKATGYGTPAGVSKLLAIGLSYRALRNAPKNHSLSLAIGPPSSMFHS